MNQAIITTIEEEFEKSSESAKKAWETRRRGRSQADAKKYDRLRNTGRITPSKEKLLQYPGLPKGYKTWHEYEEEHGELTPKQIERLKANVKAGMAFVSVKAKEPYKAKIKKLK